jgi:hypothetical protein
MDEGLTQRMLTVIHSQQWDFFQEWLDDEEQAINKEIRRATPEGLLVLQGKLQFVDKLRELRDATHLSSQAYEVEKQEQAVDSAITTRY